MAMWCSIVYWLAWEISSHVKSVAHVGVQSCTSVAWEISSHVKSVAL